jgi:hypothetical protein
MFKCNCGSEFFTILHKQVKVFESTLLSKFKYNDSGSLEIMDDFLSDRGDCFYSKCSKCQIEWGPSWGGLEDLVFQMKKDGVLIG